MVSKTEPATVRKNVLIEGSFGMLVLSSIQRMVLVVRS